MQMIIKNAAKFKYCKKMLEMQNHSKRCKKKCRKMLNNAEK